MICKKKIPSTQMAALVPVVLMSLLVHCGASAAADAAPQYTIEQPERPLSETLVSIAHETGTSVLFDSSTVRSHMSHAVSGHLSAFDAITAALQGTGLVAAQMKDGAVVVSAPNARSVAPASSASASGPSAEASSTDGATVAAAAVDSKQDDAVTRVEVTGTRLKRITAEGPAPVNIYTAKDIEQSGQPSLQRFLAGLNEVSASQPDASNSRARAQGTVQLRGLPLGSTLVLINGRRVEAVGSSSGEFFNLDLIPASAIERVEIVPVGSSAVYGGDALAGVVNVILKKSIDGISVAANAGFGRGFHANGASLATGGQGADGSYLLMGYYNRSTPLNASEREFFLDADYRRFGGRDARVRYCAPGTVSSVSGANLPGLNSSFAAIPAMAAGQSPQLADFATTSGQANLCGLGNSGNGLGLADGEDTLALHATGERRIAGSWFAFGELTLAKERTSSREIGLNLHTVIVPATNAFNPFGEDVKVTAILGASNGLTGLTQQTRFTRAIAGLRGDLTGDWEAEITASTVRDTGSSKQVNENLDATALQAALASNSPSAALNPFTAGRAATDAVLGQIWSDIDISNKGRKDQVSALARGTVLSLPAGALEAVVGVETARDQYDVSNPVQDELIRAGRRNSAVYGELRAPLFTAGPTGKSWNLAALTLAGRHDRYSDFGSANTYQAGLELRPQRSLLLRASSATSFKPPTLVETASDDAVFPADIFGLTDPARGGEAITSGTIVSSANPSLRPERGRASSFGAVWEPEGGLGAHLSATHWQVHINGLIAQVGPQTALDYESSFPGFVMREPSVDGEPGRVTSILFSEANFGSVDVAGTDMEAGYAWQSSLGRWTAVAGATRTNEYEVVLAPGAAKQNRLGQRYSDFWAPRWKSRASIDYGAGAWGMGLTSRYLGQYKDALGTSERRLGGYWTHDLAASVDLKQCLSSLATAVKAATLSLTVANLTNRRPQFVETSPYYDTTQADWRGRYVNTRISIDW
jgi:iron complex outermembrane receptor protein